MGVNEAFSKNHDAEALKNNYWRSLVSVKLTYDLRLYGLHFMVRKILVIKTKKNKYFWI